MLALDVIMAFSRLKTVYGKLRASFLRKLDRDWYHRTCYIAVPLYIGSFVLLGASFQKHLSVGALVLGWGISEVAIMVNTVAVCTFPRFAGKTFCFIP